MKMCRVCGTPHPDDVITSHHPVPCFPNCFCLQKGNDPAGCIWIRARTFPPGTSEEERRRLAGLDYMKLIVEREQAARPQKESVQ